MFLDTSWYELAVLVDWCLATQEDESRNLCGMSYNKRSDAIAMKVYNRELTQNMRVRGEFGGVELLDGHDDGWYG